MKQSNRGHLTTKANFAKQTAKDRKQNNLKIIDVYEGMKPRYAVGFSKKDDLVKPRFETIQHEANKTKRCRTRNEKVRNTISQKNRENDLVNLTNTSIESRKLHP